MGLFIPTIYRFDRPIHKQTPLDNLRRTKPIVHQITGLYVLANACNTKCWTDKDFIAASFDVSPKHDISSYKRRQNGVQSTTTRGPTTNILGVARRQIRLFIRRDFLGRRHATEALGIDTVWPTGLAMHEQHNSTTTQFPHCCGTTNRVST